ncbi:Uncharacterised protein [uncultured archaeon]|nr:Uncharacterised protein [uncultured archaeon]
MRIRYAQLVLLALMLVAAFQNILTASAQDSSENTISASDNDTSTPTARLNIQGIWNVSLAGTGITAALNQSGDSIYGMCKFEGAEPWNGVVAGLLSGNSVNMAIAAVQGKVLVSTDITGTITDDVLSGRSVSYDSDGNEASGTVTGTRISPDVSDYTPVKVKAAAEPAPASTPAVAQQPQPVQLSQPSAVQDNQATSGRFKDVTQMARGINPDVLPSSFPL